MMFMRAWKLLHFPLSGIFKQIHLTMRFLLLNVFQKCTKPTLDRILFAYSVASFFFFSFFLGPHVSPREPNHPLTL